MSVLRGMITVARVFRSVIEAGKHAMLDVNGLHGDDKLPHWQPYGFQAVPKEGSVALQVAIGGCPDSLVTILVHDRRFTLALVEGEVAMADDLGRYVWLKRDGIEVEAPSIKLGASATLGVARATDPVSMGAGAGSWTAWALAVQTATGVPPPTVPPTIASGSTAVRAAN